MQRCLDFGQHPLRGLHTGFGGSAAAAVEQIGDHLLALRGKAPQPRCVEPRLRVAQIAPQSEEAFHRRSFVARKQVDQPGASRGPAQASQLTGQLPVSGRVRLADQFIPGSDKPGRWHQVELAGDAVGLRPPHRNHDSRVNPTRPPPVVAVWLARRTVQRLAVSSRRGFYPVRPLTPAATARRSHRFVAGIA
jgi:hypothetical protein